MATNISNKKLNTTFRGNVLRLVSGTGVAQIIGILSMPILSRLYTSESFGLVALFISLTSILGIIACMHYELAIVLPNNYITPQAKANCTSVWAQYTIRVNSRNDLQTKARGCGSTYGSA